MNFLVVGLGSMGKRRIRCLRALGYKDIAGFDLRQDRRAEVSNNYGIKTFSDLDTAIREFNPEVFIISVPPDVHHIYMKRAIQEGIHFFVEASVLDTDMKKIIADLKEKKIKGIPSATLLFHPGIKKVEEIVKKGRLGKISNILYHSGQYLPGWHTYESVSEFYVSNPATGGAREIVPFELTWLTHIFGFPQKVCGHVRKTIHIQGAEKIDDTYNFLLDYQDFLATITVDVVSRFATRRLVINGDRAQLRWDWNVNQVKVYEPDQKRWEGIDYQMLPPAPGYNENIGENIYIDELDAFIKCINGQGQFVNSLERDHKVLRLLYAIEESENKQTFIRYEG